MRNSVKILTLSLVLSSTGVWAQHANSKGYYKDVFMDSGVNLTSRQDLPAARYLNLDWEVYYSATGKKGHPITKTDSLMQTFTMVGSEQDQNGILLYPDGEPRFRMIYVNGGKASTHGKSLGEAGRDHFREYLKNGGSYVGTCAGAFLASLGTRTDAGPKDSYFHLWKGWTVHTALYDVATNLFVEENSPLLKYYSFGNDMRIDSVRHWGGCYLCTEMEYPKGTEVLLRYDYDKEKLKNGDMLHKKVSSWAYKENPTSGRLVVIGSHPEGHVSGERLELMAALMRYAMDGNGDPEVKCELQNNVPVEMSKMTIDNDPTHCRIGDRQYHHFKVVVPENTQELKVNLASVDAANTHNLSLFVQPEAFAFNDNSVYKEVSLGINKQLVIEQPKAGTYYISVLGEDTVTAEKGVYGVVYTDNLDVLNGVPYKISVSF